MKFSQTILFLKIQFSMSIVFFIYTQLNVKTALFQIILYNLIRVRCQKQFYFKQFNLA